MLTYQKKLTYVAAKNVSTLYNYTDFGPSHYKNILIPEWVDSVVVECWGNGGNAAYNCGHGAGGGAYAKTTVAITNNRNIRIYLGDTYYSDHGVPVRAKFEGEAEYFCFAASGLSPTYVDVDPYPTGWSPGVGGQAADCIGDVKYSGGNGHEGLWSDVYSKWESGGGGGGCAGSTGKGNNSAGRLGGKAKSEYGGRGGNGASYSEVAENGQAYGSGAGGARTVNSVPAAAKGYSGAIRISYTIKAHNI